jgi:type I restriction enzyme S subunit
MSEWNDTTLGEFVGFQRGHDLTESERRAGNVPVMGSAGQNGFHDTALAKGPGIVVGRSGASFGQVHFSPIDYWPHNTALYVTDFKGNDERFAFYFLKAIDFSGYNSGSAQPSLNRNFIYSIPVRIPPLAEQKAIAAVLGALDDKIELNRRMNATLEAMARGLFQSWFVDFDPVRAKLDGRTPVGIDAATAALFPEQLEDSPLGHIPKGWAVARLDETASVMMGLSPDGDSYNSQGIGAPLINGPVEFGEYFPVKTKWTESATRFAAEGDLIFCVRGSTTGRRVISDGAYGIGRGVCAIRAKDGFQSFLYQTINVGLDRLLEKTTGSVFPSLSAPDIKGLFCAEADQRKPYLKAYERSVRRGRWFKRIQENNHQSRTLATLRDTLLPKLLSGELSVAGARN